MTIEETIKEFIDERNSRPFSYYHYEEGKEDVQVRVVDTTDVSTWKWPGKPYSVRFGKRSDLRKEFKIVDYQISQASLAECLTSTIPYIRECKRWMAEQEKAK